MSAVVVVDDEVVEVGATVVLLTGGKVDVVEVGTVVVVVVGWERAHWASARATMGDAQMAAEPLPSSEQKLAIK